MNWLRTALLSILLLFAGPALAMGAGFHGRPGGGRGGEPHGEWHGGDRGWHGGERGWHGGGEHEHGDWDDHAHFGFYLGGPAWPYWGPWGPWYPPQSHVIINTPPAPNYYPVPARPGPDEYWYYCGSARAYYPYVKTCPEGWMQVVPHASAGGAAPPPR